MAPEVVWQCIKHVVAYSEHIPCSAYSLNLSGALAAESCQNAILLFHFYRTSTHFSQLRTIDGKFCHKILSNLFWNLYQKLGRLQVLQCYQTSIKCHCLNSAMMPLKLGCKTRSTSTLWKYGWVWNFFICC